MISKLPVSSTVAVTNILQEISSCQPVMLKYYTFSQLSFTGNCENEETRRWIGKAIYFVLFVDGNKANKVSGILKMLKPTLSHCCLAHFITGFIEFL
jgi:hypothetical protein